MRFLTVIASSLPDLALTLNQMSIGSGRVIYTGKVGKNYEALIDMYPTLVITADDLIFEDEPEIKKIITSSA